MDDARLLENGINMIDVLVFECISELTDDERVGHLAFRVYRDLDRLESEMWKRLTELRKASAKASAKDT